ncbi:MAG: hypothetical protein QM315_08605 [Bacillota bacterium]|jgi:hypothetical protein|nr:hypothetical protein [Bacillota bacterium]
MRNSMKILCLIIVAVLILLGLSSVFSKTKGKNLEEHVFQLQIFFVSFPITCERKTISGTGN